MTEMHECQRRVAELKERLRVGGIMIASQARQLDQAHKARVVWKVAFFAQLALYLALSLWKS